MDEQADSSDEAHKGLIHPTPRPRSPRPRSPQPQDPWTTERVFAIIVEFFLIPLSFITGQLIHSPNLKARQNEIPLPAKIFIGIWFVLSVIVCSVLNTVPTILVVYSWIDGSVNVFNVSYLFNVPIIDNDTNKIPSIVLRELPTKSIDVHSLSDSQTADNLKEFEAFAKLVMAFFAISSTVSFGLFIYSLVCTYKLGNKGQNPPLDPFQFYNANTSTRLDLKESRYFISLLVLNLLLWLGCLGYFSGLHFNKPYHTGNSFKSNPDWAEGIVFGIYMYSMLCTIVSCFIFSKIAHSVTHKWEGQLTQFRNHEKRRNEEDSGVSRLIEEDLQFTKMAQASIIYFEFWFTVHWIFYTVTSFLSIALFLDMLQFYMNSNFDPSNGKGIGFSLHELAVVGLFTLQHCFLFLYPCFKAAAVTVSREKLIKKVNAHPLNEHLSLEKKQLYIHHLKNKKFGFRISFFCARLRFGFNVAYISIFIGLLGVLLKLTGVF